MKHPYISPEKPGEFEGVTPALAALIRYFREAKALHHQLERERIALASEPPSEARDHMLETLDNRIDETNKNMVGLMTDIAKLTPDYAVALAWAVKNMGFDEGIGTVRFNKRRDNCYTFGMPGKPVMAVWVEGGKVVRTEPIDW